MFGTGSYPTARATAVAGAALVAMLGLTLVACGGGDDAPDHEAHGDDFEATSLATPTHLVATDTDWGGVQIAVGGLPLEKVKGLRIAGVDVLPTILASADSGAATIIAAEDSVVFLIAKAPAQLGAFNGAVVELETSDGVVADPVEFSMSSGFSDAAAAGDMHALASSKPKCTKLTWQKPTALPKVSGCGYNGTGCARSDRAHTGIDYGGSGDVVAVADGSVVGVEPMNSRDHGMGSNVIVMHVHNCAVVYSTYNHLASIDGAVKKNATIKRGARIGKSGGSGYGKADYWGRHLHFEVKTLGVSGNPRGVGKKNKTCQQDPKNAMASTCWGYVDPKLGATAYGYSNPGDFF